MKSEKKSVIIRLIVSVVVLGALIGIGFAADLISGETFSNIHFDFSVLLKLLVMIAGVICAQSLISFILKLPNPKSHRVRSVLSIISSVLMYVSAIVILCWGLAILGVNVSTIVASVGIVALILLLSHVVWGDVPIFRLFINNFKNIGTESLQQ